MILSHYILLPAAGLILFGIKLFPDNTAPAAYYTEIAQRYQLKELFYLDLWPFAPSQLVLISPETAALITTVEDYPVHDVATGFVSALIGKTMIAAVNGQPWKALHNMIAPAFRPSALKRMVPVIADQTMSVFHATLSRHAASGQAFAMEDVAAQLVFRMSSKVIFGVSVSDEANERLLADFAVILEYAKILTQVQPGNPFRKVFLWWKQRAAARRIDAFLEPLANERHIEMIRRDSAEGRDKEGLGKSTMSVLDHILIGLLPMENGGQAPDTLTPAVAQTIVENLKGLLLGAYGTTTDTLCFIYILLSTHPTVMQKLREEHDRVFGTGLQTTQHTLKQSPDKLSELRYTTAVIKETLRLFPVGFGVRSAKSGIPALEYQGQTYPTPNQMIIPCTHTIHYDAEIFQSPATFNPERFMDPSTAIPLNAWRPFERGPRACMGRDLAMQELRIILLLTVRSFEFECVGLQPRAEPSVLYTDLDLRLGDLAFQESSFSAKPRGGAVMRVASVLGYDCV
ncbi:cytochrome P450 [Aspergillus pseudodeflectus]|uniref:Cytochrome P450 n=1 Tax=Aspergillus pseudodeflectus TaxID=176178 RepID=A0ABR4K472_9EURO